MTSCNPNKFTKGRNFRSCTKAQIVLACMHWDEEITKHRHIDRERAKDAARTKHLVLSRNRISDEELASWGRLFSHYGMEGLKQLALSKNTTYNKRRLRGACIKCDSPSPSYVKCLKCRGLESEMRKAA